MTASTLHRPTAGASFYTAGGGRVVLRAWRGEGSYARVYQAAYASPGTDPLDARVCAIKLPKPEIPGSAERLQAEGDLLARLDHPRVVSLWDRGEAGTPFLVLEWLDGETLLDLVQARRRLPLRLALELLAGITEAVSHFHECGIAHGDVRGQNVLVLPKRGAVLTDPEQALLAPEGDLHAVGTLLYLMLTGREPGPGEVLSTAGGHNRAVVELAGRLASSAPPTTQQVLAEIQRLRARL